MIEADNKRLYLHDICMKKKKIERERLTSRDNRIQAGNPMIDISR